MASDVFGIVGTTVVGAFHVEAVVAEGGFGVVYRAYHAGFRAHVALKCLKIPQYLSRADQDRFEAQFQAEAELLFKLSAGLQAVVRPLHVEAVIAPDGTFMPFLALEWLEGETLDAIAKRRAARREPPFSLGELVTLLDPVARALASAHHFEGPEGPMSIVHRDMKPENLFLARVSGQDVVKILDFGIAKAKSIASQVAGRVSQREGEGLASFTPAFGAPEQWSPRRLGQTGPWTDVWGLALTLVELMAGRSIVDGDHTAMMGTVLDPARRPTPRAEGVRVGDAVEAVFRRALAVDPRERHPDVGQFWDALLLAVQTDREGGSRIPELRPRELGARSALPGAALAADSIPDLEPLPSARSGNHPAAQPSARSGHFPAASSVPPGASRPPVSAPRQSIPGGMMANSRFDDEDEGETGIDLETAPFSATEAEIPVVAARQSSAPPASERRASASPAPSFTPRGPSLPASAVSSAAPPGASLAPRVTSPAPSRFSTIEADPGPGDWARRFALPAAMVVAGVVITVIDGAYASAKGEVFTLGPLRLAWLAASLVLAGIGLSLYRFLGSDG